MGGNVKFKVVELNYFKPNELYTNWQWRLDADVVIVSRKMKLLVDTAAFGVPCDDAAVEIE